LSLGRSRVSGHFHSLINPAAFNALLMIATISGKGGADFGRIGAKQMS